jgi:hypothetical protein
MSSSLDTLPSQPNGQSVQMNIQEKKTVDQETARELVSNLQEAAKEGATELPARDIPQQPTQTMDPRVQQNYEVAPQTNDKRDYIQDYERRHEMQRRMDAERKSSNEMESIFDKLQFPIIVMVLFVLFTMPSVNKKLSSLMPSIFANPLSGNIVKGAMLAGSLYGVLTFMD